MDVYLIDQLPANNYIQEVAEPSSVIIIIILLLFLLLLLLLLLLLKCN